MDAFATQISDILGKVEPNDRSMKQEISDKFGILENPNLDMKQSIAAKTQELASLTAALNTANQEHIDLQTDYTKLRVERLIPMEAAVVKVQTDMNQFHTGMAAQADVMDNEIKATKMHLEHAKSVGDSSAVGSQDDFTGNKPIMEYKVMQELKTLTNTKTGFRDWRTRMRDGLVSSFKTEAFLGILDWAEDVNIQPVTGEEDLNAVMEQAFAESGVPKHLDTWKRISSAMKSLLTQKSEDSSEAFLMTKRAQTGIAAW